MLTLTIAHQRELKARAHTLNPVVMIGKTGLSASVIEELNRGLLSHELIKVKAQIDDRIARNALFEEICQQLDAAPVQHIGKIFIIYRPKPEDKESAYAPGKKKREPSRTKRSFQN
ncbi:MAG: YhbY family RNA-binding protein [Pseudomonadota bacterium]